MTLPGKTNVNAADNNQITSLTDNDSVDWLVVKLDGTHQQNWNKVKAVPTDAVYVKYIMYTDWTYPETSSLSVYGQYKIWDLNGHTMRFGTVNYGCMFSWRNTQFLEITDSSTGGNGHMYPCGNGYVLAYGGVGRNLIVSGGTIHAPFYDAWYANVLVTGGNYVLSGLNAQIVQSNQNNRFFYADNVTRSGNAFSSNTTVTHTNLAVSTSNLVSGVYNYEFMQVLTLKSGVGVLEKILRKTMPYGLLYRASADQPYQVLATL